jgi:glyceraldehyde-3-phosphate dehydrogenase (NADP+)
MVQPLMMLDGKVLSVPDDQPLADVMGCCVDHDSILTPRRIGKMPQMTEQQALQILEAAKQAYKGGAGIWPQTALSERRQAIQAFLRHLQTQREEIIQVLMWEIGKNQVDATAEFDRTVQFIETMMDEMQHDPEFNSEWQTVGSTRAHVRRAALGVVLILGPYNYPLNETWAMVFAALLTGNIVILKIPTVGGLCHLLTSKFLIHNV